MYKKTVLDNGLKIISYPMPQRESVAVGIWIKTGGRYETGANKGISHYLEHMVFKGTKKYSCRKIKESLEGVGGSLNGFTSEELTCYLAKMPRLYLKRAVDVLSDMVLSPALPQEEIEKERAVILEEIKMYRDLPQSYVYELLDELLWPNQPLGEPIIGTAESVSSITREMMASFREKYYSAANIVVSVAGAFEYRGLINLLTKTFSRLPKGSDVSFAAAEEKQNQAQLKVFHKETEQTHLALGFHSFKRDHPLKHALGILHVILGGNMSSRLFNELREKKGLAYEIGTQVKRFQDTGAFMVHAGMHNDKVDEAIKAILGQFEAAKADLVTADEFKRAKDFYLGQLVLSLEDTLDHMLWIGETTATLDKTYSLEQVTKEVRKVDKEELRRAANELFKEENLSLALIGPLKDRERQIQDCLKMG